MKKIKNEEIEIIEEPKKNNNYFIKILALTGIIIFLISIAISLKNNTYNNLGYSLIGSGLILLFIICFTTISLRNNIKRNNIIIVFGIIILMIYSIFNILVSLNLLDFGFKDSTLLSFYNNELKETKIYLENNKIEYKVLYEYSDYVEEYNIISQSIEPGTNLNDIDIITLIVSLGPDYNKEVIVPNFIGWNIDDVIKYIEENKLNNIKLNYIDSSNEENTIVNQNKSGTMKRSDLIELNISKPEQTEINIEDFTNKSLLYTENFLLQHGIKYEIKYENSDKIKKNYVIDQNKKNVIINPEEDFIEITASKGKLIEIPNFKKMNQDQINDFVIENNLKINYKTKYDEDSKLGDIIESNYNEGDKIEIGDTINITISKGKLEMIDIKSINEFKKWANENNINYDIEYEYDNSEKNTIIKSSHKTGDAIKENDTVIITVSKGKSITIPSFINMNKTEIQNKCNNLKLSCSFKYTSCTEKTKKDIAVNQSKQSGTKVSEGTNIIISLSEGICEKVTIPTFVGMTKSQIQTKCNSLGLSPTFKYETSYSTKYDKDICTKQSKTGTVVKGSNITITLSKGKAKTYSIQIYGEQLTAGNASKTISTLKTFLSSKTSGITFNYKQVACNQGSGYLAENSDIKVGKNTLIQGKTYTIRVCE